MPIVVQGGAETRRALRELGRRLSVSDRVQLALAAGEALRTWMVDSPGYLSNNRLKRQTGALAGQWRPQPRGRVVVVGSNLKYAPVQEYGSSGEAHTVRAHRRRRPASRGRSKRARLARDAGPVSVRQHSRVGGIKPKWYVRDTVRLGQRNAVRAVGIRLQRLIREAGE